MAGEEEMGDAASVELHADKFEHRDELGEDQNFVALGDEGFEGLEEGLEFGGRRREGFGARFRAVGGAFFG